MLVVMQYIRLIRYIEWNRYCYYVGCGFCGDTYITELPRYGAEFVDGIQRHH